jgi:hypothetical protein
LPAPDPEPLVAALLPLPGLLEPCPELPPWPFPLLPPGPEPPGLLALLEPWPPRARLRELGPDGRSRALVGFLAGLALG